MKRPVIEPRPQQVFDQERGQPYFIQIGFDFGTSFSKCVCRDVMTDKAWVHIPPEFSGQELPFLIPSAILFRNGKIQHVAEQGIQYPEGGLYHLKHALVKVALDQLDDPMLEPYKRAHEQSCVARLSRFIELCALYFLAGAVGTVREQVRQRMPDFGAHHDDYMAINLAVPVSDVEELAVNELYNEVLCAAWSLADTISGHPPIDLKELELLRRQELALIDQHISQACFIYPEVSANVQSFVRSRVSSPGMYLFSDTGAGTVDQSTFIFFRRADGTDHLTYLHGSVLPLGSGQIEFQAAKINGRTGSQALEMWRERKERGDLDQALVQARDLLGKQLIKGSTATLASTKKKLYLPDSIQEMRVIFGGGGHCEHPYKTSVIAPFSGPLFRRPFTPDTVGLPIPIDLDLDDTKKRWMKRLSAAYGLSFEKGDLAGFTYPKDVDIPEPEEVWRRRGTGPDT